MCNPVCALHWPGGWKKSSWSFLGYSPMSSPVLDKLQAATWTCFLPCHRWNMMKDGCHGHPSAPQLRAGQAYSQSLAYSSERSPAAASQKSSAAKKHCDTVFEAPVVVWKHGKRYLGELMEEGSSMVQRMEQTVGLSCRDASGMLMSRNARRKWPKHKRLRSN